MPSIPFRPDFSCRVVVHDRHSPPHRQRNSNIRAAREPLSLRNRLSASVTISSWDRWSRFPGVERHRSREVRFLLAAIPACRGECSIIQNSSGRIFFNRDHFLVLRELFLFPRREMFQVVRCGSVDE
jgi:hypothetical protein